MNLNKLMKQAQKMQEQMARTQAELEDKTVEVTAGGRQGDGSRERRRRRPLNQDRERNRRPGRHRDPGRPHPEWCPASHRQRQRDGEQRDDKNHRRHARPQRARDVRLGPDSGVRVASRSQSHGSASLPRGPRPALVTLENADLIDTKVRHLFRQSLEIFPLLHVRMSI